MRRAYTGVLLAMVFCTDAGAAKNEEIIRYPSLLMFGTVYQSAGLSYTFGQHNSSNSSSTSSSLRERYSLSTVAAILDPHLVNMQILAGLSYTQQFGEPGTTSLLDGEYNLTANAFDLTYHPVTFSTTRTTSYISNGYLPTYSLTNVGNQIAVTFLNAHVPVQIYYVHTTSETDGLANDSSSVSESAGISLHHDIPGISNTNLALNTSGTKTGNSTSSAYNVSASNSLSLDKAHRYRLSTSLDIADSKTNAVPQRNVGLSADLSCAFGKALFGSFSDRFTYNSTLNFDNEDQTQRTNMVSASLSHRLFQSLLTNVTVSANQGTSLGGTNSSYSGTTSVSYTKRLPAQSTLTATLGLSRSVSDQSYPVSSVSARDEEHPSVNWGDHVEPFLAGRLTSVVSVTSLDRTTTYLEGTDYRVDLPLGFIEILAGGEIVPGTGILISYTVEINPSISYQTDSLGTSATLSLFGGRYTLGASYSAQDSALLSGEATNQALMNSTNVNLRADANFRDTLMGAEYSMVDSTQEKSHRFGVYGSHNIRTTHDAVIGISARNTYSVLESTGEGGEGTSQNALSLSASYSRRVFDWLNFTTSLTANDTRSSSSYSDFIGLRGALSGAYNQLQLSLSGQTLYRLSGSSSTLDNNISCSVTRFF